MRKKTTPPLRAFSRADQEASICRSNPPSERKKSSRVPHRRIGRPGGERVADSLKALRKKIKSKTLTEGVWEGGDAAYGRDRETFFRRAGLLFFHLFFLWRKTLTRIFFSNQENKKTPSNENRCMLEKIKTFVSKIEKIFSLDREKWAAAAAAGKKHAFFDRFSSFCKKYVRFWKKFSRSFLSFLSAKNKPSHRLFVSCWRLCCKLHRLKKYQKSKNKKELRKSNASFFSNTPCAAIFCPRVGRPTATTRPLFCFHTEKKVHLQIFFYPQKSNNQSEMLKEKMMRHIIFLSFFVQI